VEEGRGEVGPEEVHEECEGGEEVEDEAIVFVGGDFWGCSRYGFELVGGGVGGSWSGGA